MNPAPDPLEISIPEVQRLRAGGEEFVFLDCREPDERAICAIEGTHLIPMGEFPDRLDELAPQKDRRIVIHCHHGGRSLRAAQWLRQQGFSRAQSMAGGIDQWAVEVEPGMPRY